MASQVIGTPDYGKVPTSAWGNPTGEKKRGQLTPEQQDAETRAMITGARPDMQPGFSFGNPTGSVSVGQFSNDPRIPSRDASGAGAGANYGPGSLSGPGYGEQANLWAASQLGQPGAYENQWAQHGQFYNTPQAGQNFTAGALGTAQEGMRTGGAAGQMFGDFQATAGQNNPGLGAYYENAARVGQEGIDRAAASRGAYGASSAMDASAEMNTNLAADRAKNEADYNLRRLSTGGELAQGMDSSQRGWFNSGTQAASQMDQGEQARVNAGMDAAGAAQRATEGRYGQIAGYGTTAQNLGEGREQQGFDNTLAIGKLMGGAAKDSYDAAFAQLDAAEQSLVTLALGGDAAAIAKVQGSRQEVRGAVELGLKAYDRVNKG